MAKRILTKGVVIGLATMLGLSNGVAAEGMYGSLTGRAVFQNDAEAEGGSGLDADIEYDNPGWGLSGIVGYGWRSNWRLEGELAYRGYDLDKAGIREDGGLGNALGVGSLSGQTVALDGEVDSLALLASIYYDFPTRSVWKPYIGAGIGVTQQEVEAKLAGVEIVDDDDTVFAYQLALGLGYSLSRMTTIYAGYRYFAYDDVEFDAVGGDTIEATDNDSHDIELGVRWRF